MRIPDRTIVNLAVGIAIAIAAELTFGLSFQGLANAADVKVLSSPALTGVISEIGRQFESATSNRLVPDFEVFAVLKRRIDAGEEFDIAILSPALIESLISTSKVAGDTRAHLGRQGMGLGVRKGSPAPNINSVEAFKQTMRRAKSVAYFNGGGAGEHFLTVLNRLDIAADMKSKLKGYDTAGVTLALASGDVEYVVAGIGTVMALQGVEAVVPFPSELQDFRTYTGGVSTASKQPEAARMLLKLFTTPSGKQIMTSNGLQAIE
jgi:molybdate transport system substrate-binding protein